MLNFLLIIMILEREKKFSLQKITYHIIKDVNFLNICFFCRYNRLKYSCTLITLNRRKGVKNNQSLLFLVIK